MATHTYTVYILPVLSLFVCVLVCLGVVLLLPPADSHLLPIPRCTYNQSTNQAQVVHVFWLFTPVVQIVQFAGVVTLWPSLVSLFSPFSSLLSFSFFYLNFANLSLPVPKVHLLLSAHHLWASLFSSPLPACCPDWPGLISKPSPQVIYNKPSFNCLSMCLSSAFGVRFKVNITVIFLSIIHYCEVIIFNLACLHRSTT